MPRYDVSVKKPEHYARVKAEQEELAKEYFRPGIMTARICPYCGYKVEMLARGQHDPSQVKCLNCGEEVTFPPIFCRRVKGYYRR